MDKRSQSSDNNEGPFLPKGSALKTSEHGNKETVQLPLSSNDGESQPTSNVMAKGLHRKKKRLAKRRRSVSKHRKSHREHSQSEDDVKCSSKHSSSSNMPKGRKTRSRNMKEKQAALTEEGREGPLGRRAADDTANVTRERESKCKSLSETRQAHWLPQQLVGNSSTALDRGYQDRIEGAARLEEDAPAIRDSDQQTPNVRDKCATSSSAGISVDCLNGKPSFQEQMPQSSKSKEACLPPTQLPQRDGDGRQDGRKPVHVHGLENAAGSLWQPPVAGTTGYNRFEGGQVHTICFPVALVATLVALALLTALFFVLATRRDGGPGPKAFEGGIFSRSQLKHLCSAEACRRAVDALVDSMLKRDDSSSCAQFGKQACGGWTKHNTRRPSFEEEVLEQSIQRLHTSLMEMSKSGNETTGDTTESNMAIFYK
ncbi:hypothetical protein MRX96_036027 [Rhipicephalus microplus]